MKGEVLVVAGIDTGTGKTVATGLLARAFRQSGFQAITQKIVQTGCAGFPDDIAVHRELMGLELQDADRAGLTCPYVFAFPASPHLAAEREGVTIDVMKIRQATFRLQKQFSPVLLEGVGGLLVPLNRGLLFADYVRDAGYGMLLVTSTRLGSINHTLLSLEACERRGIAVRAVLYNHYGEADPVIAADTREVIVRHLAHRGIPAPVIDLYEGALAGCATDFPATLLAGR